MSPQDFKPGDRVLYVPKHARGNTSHADCERGTVAFTNDLYVFVKYGTHKSQATAPADLVKEPQCGA